MEGLVSVISDIIQNQGWLAFPACFVGGVISSASPCVLAMIPLVIGYVGGYAEGSQKKAIQYSLMFTLGLTITFTTLGIIAGALGRLFGDVGGFWHYVLPPVAILLGLYLLFSDKLNFNIGLSQRFLPRKKALLGAFLIGLFFGIVASPCATPVLAVILTYAVTRQNIVLSGGLLLSYALGHWVLVFAAGISAGFAQKVLASKGIANFSSYSKKIAGVILIGVGIYLFTYLL
ncbi:MAG: cytochrome c biogenesis protein CcdA [Dehalococcoidales bacterium]|nr:cytochrome c biogenesis protein CcdA [Dehalococcoidales bacterium]